MSKNTVKPGLTSKRSKRVVENSQFDAFARRILRAYARRVAAGDVEALRGLAMLSSEVDAVVREAVRALRKSPYSYSWDELGQRLGVSRQAVQMRYGERTNRGALDRRITQPGLAVTVATLAEVFADHHPGIPAATTCPGCGFRFPDKVRDCPTNATVRPLLYRRRNEDMPAVRRLLTDDQFDDLRDRPTARSNQAAARTSAAPRPEPATGDLFDLLNGAGAAS